MKVKLLDHMGTDLDVVNDARVSMAKSSESLSAADKKLIRFLAEGVSTEERKSLFQRIKDAHTDDEAEALFHHIRLLNRHEIPFAHCQAKMLFTGIPLSVARQLWKSNVGAVGGDAGNTAFSEESRRYIDTVPDLYEPDVWRKRGASVKQGSSDEPVDLRQFSSSYVTIDTLEDQVDRLNEMALTTYRDMIAAEVCPEQARKILPQSMLVSFRWTGSLLFWARLCRLRLDSHAQKETQLVAAQISDIARSLWPVSWAALRGEPI